MTQTNEGYQEKDKLKRGGFANSITSVLRNANKLKRDDDRQSFVLAIDASWGSGKSFFLNYLVDHLKSLNNADHASHDPDNICIPLLYNAWEYDYWESAFDPFVSNLFKKNFHANFSGEDLQESATEGMFKSILDISMKLGKGFVAKKCGDIFGEDTVKELLTKDQLIEYIGYASDVPMLPLFQLHKDIEALRNGLAKVAKSPKHIIFLIDELDRAKPLFAIQTLEIIKHIFDSPRISYIFALDMEQLSHTVKSVYGDGIDSIGYLQRFFDVVMPMPQYDIPMGDYITSVITAKGFDPDIAYTVSDAINQLSKPFNLGLRDINFLVSSIALIVYGKLNRAEPGRVVDSVRAILNILCIKIKHRNVFNSFFSDGYPRMGDDQSSRNAINDEFDIIHRNHGNIFLPFLQQRFFREPLDSLKTRTNTIDADIIKRAVTEFERYFDRHELKQQWQPEMSMADMINSLLIISDWDWKSMVNRNA